MNAIPLTIPTRCAHWGYTDHRYFGHAVFAELAGEETVTGLLALSVLGRRLSKEECLVLDDIATTASLADPRIWPLKLTRLVASYGCTGPAVAAGLLILEGARIGPWSTVKAAEALVELHAAIGGRYDDTDLVAKVVNLHIEKHHVLWGFGTPFRDHDERLVAFRECMIRRRRDRLPYFRTMDAIIDVVRQRRKMEPNMSIASAAAFLDLGLSVEQAGPISFALMFHMFLANGVEGRNPESEVLRELPENRIRYVGKEARVSPRRHAVSGSPER
jgi:hypothetical protein